MEKHCPDVLDGARACLGAASRSEGPQRVTVEIGADRFENVPAISVDYAVMERANNMKMVPCTFDWSDIGSWQALSELMPADAQGNRFSPDVLSKGASNCFVAAEDRLVSLVGVHDLVVVDTADALLVADRNATQDVKDIFNRLKESGHEAAMLHRTVHRPWGSYTVLETGPGFKIKRIEVKPGGRLSLQSHRHRSEHWVVVRGTAKVTNGPEMLLLEHNQSTYVPVGQKHRLENPGTEILAMIEVQCGDYLGEDDIERYDDVYGRN
jgi:mannose-1-phosphate guanylyltransferase